MADQKRVTEAERERAIHTLRESYARGDLDGEQFEQKLNALFTVQPSPGTDAAQPAHSEDEAHVLFSEDGASLADLDALARHLASGERTEWVGKPDPTKHFTGGDAFLIPFSLMWCCFAIFWESSAISGGGGPFFVLWGVPFVAIGLYFVFGRFIYKAHRKRRTVYAVTNRRVLAIVRGRQQESVEATYLHSIPNISTTLGASGRGSVEFGLSSPMASRYANSGLDFFARGQLATEVSFYDIKDPQGVADLVERLRRADRAA